jgi:3-hydroxybutyryl-CoA dehydratase
MMRDWMVGDTLPPLAATVDGPSMKVLSLIMRDPNPLHYDPDFVHSIGLGDRPINQGTINMAYPINALLRIVESPSQLRRFACRFQGRLVAGDRVVACGTVSAVDEETVTLDIWLDREEGGRVLTGTATLARR